jgi:holliday junction DNA helicase RuvA
MICRIAGTLESVDGLSLTIAPKGSSLAYEVLAPAFLAERLKSQLGQPVTLTTFEYLESQGQGTSFIPRLIGFQAPSERDFFELFTTVKGIGNKKALRAMVHEPAAIARAIVAKDAKALTQLPEIGKRMAETVIAELHGKVDAFLSDAEVQGLNAAAEGKPTPGQSDPTIEEAIEALIALGEARTDAEAMVAKAATRARREGRELSSATSVIEAVFGGRSG